MAPIARGDIVGKVITTRAYVRDTAVIAPTSFVAEKPLFVAEKPLVELFRN